MPRLTRLIQWQACLSRSEAEALITAWRAGHSSCSEAVMHYGGAQRILRDAIRNRHIFRTLTLDY